MPPATAHELFRQTRPGVAPTQTPLCESQADGPWRGDNSSSGFIAKHQYVRYGVLQTGRDMVRHDGKYVSYLRVSTGKQARSGLGLEAQRAAVTTWLNGGRWKLVDEVVEIKSGKSDKNRPALQRALDACRRYKARLIISRLDRLSRDPVFLLSLRDAGIDFVALDMPEANRMMVGIMAMVAEQEREALSQRTKDALAAKKAQGIKLGNPRPETLTFNDPAIAAAAAVKAGAASVNRQTSSPN